MAGAAGTPPWATPRKATPSLCSGFICSAGSKPRQGSRGNVRVRVARSVLGRSHRRSGVTIDQAGADRYADQIGGARGAELGLDPARAVRRGFIRDAKNIGDLRKGAALRQETQHLDVAPGQVA